MSKLELIQRCRIRIREVKQTSIQKLESDINSVLQFLDEEELRIAKEDLTNGAKPLVEATTKGEPDRE